jgi:hypothetical protein
LNKLHNINKEDTNYIVDQHDCTVRPSNMWN